MRYGIFRLAVVPHPSRHRHCRAHPLQTRLPIQWPTHPRKNRLDLYKRTPGFSALLLHSSHTRLS